MSRVPLVSVLMPVRNGGRFIDEALRSLVEQRESDWEALVVDDGSSDDTAARLERWSQRDGRVRGLRHPGGVNRGVSRSRRLALEHARGELVALLDADDTWHPEKLARQVEAMSAEPGVTGRPVLCHTGVRVTHEADAPSMLHLEASFNLFESRRAYDARRASWFGECNRICASSVLCRAEPLRRLAPAFDQLFQYEDWTWWALLSGEGPFVFVPGAWTGYRVHAAAATAAVEAAPLRELYATIEHWLAVSVHARDGELRELAMARLTATLASAAACYGDGEPRAEAIEAALDRGQLLARLGECERELARLRRFWPRRLVGWWRRRRARRGG